MEAQNLTNHIASPLKDINLNAIEPLPISNTFPNLHIREPCSVSGTPTDVGLDDGPGTEDDMHDSGNSRDNDLVATWVGGCFADVTFLFQLPQEGLLRIFLLLFCWQCWRRVIHIGGQRIREWMGYAGWRWKCRLRADVKCADSEPTYA